MVYRLKYDSNFQSGLFLLLFSTILIILTPNQIALYEGSDALSPRLIPYITLYLILVGSVILLIMSFVSPAKKASEQLDDEDRVSSDEDEEVVELTGKSIPDLLIFLIVPIFIIATSETIGFTFASIIGLVISLYYYQVRKWYMLLLVGVLIPVFIDVVFRKLEIFLPLGFWENFF